MAPTRLRSRPDMRIRLLGTGSADGWPNPFCACSSCEVERADGRTRRPSAALIDDVILVDCGPTTPHPPAGLSLRDVQHVLLTHGHPDHLNPAFLLSRSWVTSEPLDVWGPPLALQACEPWLAPDSPVRLHPLAVARPTTLHTPRGAYTVTAIPAAHAHGDGDGDAMAQEALLLLLAAPDSTTLLHATDTGPLSPESIAALPQGELDVLLVDETFGHHVTHGTGHHDLTTLPLTLSALRARGHVHDRTRVLATHLSHHNPPRRVLRAELAAMNVELPEDLDVIDTMGRRGHRLFVLGGARSGKSHHAEAVAAQFMDVTYVATSRPRPDDDEWCARVGLHRQRRPSQWTTVETMDLAHVLRTGAPGSAVLIDCLTLWLTQLLDDMDAWRIVDAPDPDPSDVSAIHDHVTGSLDELITALEDCAAQAILVSNEVGMGLVPETAGGRLFRDLLGMANARVASACDRVDLVVAGTVLTGSPR